MKEFRAESSVGGGTRCFDENGELRREGTDGLRRESAGELRSEVGKLRCEVGKLFIVRPEALDPEIVWNSVDDLPRFGLCEVNDRMRQTALKYPVGGIILFAHNIKDPVQLSRFVSELKSLPGHPLIYIDEEGGRVARIARNPNFDVPRFESTAALAGNGPGRESICRNESTPAEPGAAESTWNGTGRETGYGIASTPAEHCLGSDATESTWTCPGRETGCSGTALNATGPEPVTAAADRVHRAATEIGRYLRRFGFDVDFAPVADVNTNPENIVIGDRAFSSDPETAAPLVSAFVRGLAEAGVISCLKHFPGHGDTFEDSHVGFASSAKDWEQLDRCEMIPFRAGIDAGVPMVMSAHIALPNVTGTDCPSTMSELILRDRLRGDLGFRGVVVSDALEMGAITSRFSSAEAAVRTFLAGADLLLAPLNLSEAYEGVLEALHSGRIPASRLGESLARISALRQGTNSGLPSERVPDTN